MSRAGFAAIACSLALAGCAMYGGGPLDEQSPGVVPAQRASPELAAQRVRPGESRAEVQAALGAANVIAFDSGWQVWVYRWLAADRTPESATELDILFDPSGTVRKLRVRPGTRRG